MQTIRRGDVLPLWSALPIPTRALFKIQALADLYKGDLIERGLLKIASVAARIIKRNHGVLEISIKGRTLLRLSGLQKAASLLSDSFLT